MSFQPLQGSFSGPFSGTVEISPNAHVERRDRKGVRKGADDG